MSRRQPTYPFEAYDPRLKAVLLRGEREEFTIPCATKSAASRLQFYLNAYRKAARAHFGEDQSDQWKHLFIAEVGIPKELGGTVVRVRPRFQAFADALAGFEAAQEAEQPSADADPLSEFLPKE